jgi:hypothetical protein|tara:strand:+ start:300 stop:1133 length:834 start_codon:yes stop_codon:yes gene_type:complete
MINNYIKYFKILPVLIGLIFITFETSAQLFKPNSEIGFKSGISYYTGDLNSNHFNFTKPAAGLIIRRNIDRRFSVKAEILILNIKADDRTSEDLIRLNRGLHFRSSIQELSSQIEFNFLAYEVGNLLYNWTPYLFSGISIYNFNPQAENSIGEWVDLQPLGTEGQGTTAYPTRKKYSRTQISVPMGGGVKLSLSKTLNLILSFSARKTYTDYLDDVSTTYPGSPNEFNSNSIEMSDPTYSHNKNEQRGNELKNDWYYFTGLTISFRLSGNTKGCDLQ